MDQNDDTEEGKGKEHQNTEAKTLSRSQNYSPELSSKRKGRDPPVRKTWHNSLDLSPPRSRQDSPDLSPPRQRSEKSEKVQSKGE